MIIKKFNEAYGKKAEEYLDTIFNVHTHEYVVCSYPREEMYHGTLDVCLKKLEQYRASFVNANNHLFIIEREIISRHIPEDEIKELLTAKKYNL